MAWIAVAKRQRRLAVFHSAVIGDFEGCPRSWTKSILLLLQMR